jgi:hypothetical protein
MDYIRTDEPYPRHPIGDTEMSRLTFSVTRNHSGAFVVSAIVDDRLVSRQYVGHSRREAIRLFVAEVSPR